MQNLCLHNLLKLLYIFKDLEEAYIEILQSVTEAIIYVQSTDVPLEFHTKISFCSSISLFPLILRPGARMITVLHIPW